VRTRKLGTTDVTLSEVGLGTWGLASDAYGSASEQRFEGVVEKALEVGVKTFDMAPIWGEGTAERVVAKAVGEKRSEVRYVTRAGARWKDGALDRSWDDEVLTRDLDGSLERLATDRVDVWLLHDPPEEIWKDEERIPKLVERLKKEKKILAWGATIGTAEQARMVLAKKPDAICLAHNIIASDLLADLHADVTAAKAGVIVRSPLFHGLLAGRWAEYRSFAAGDHRRDRWSVEALKSRVRTVDRFRFLVHDEIGSLAEAALRFVLANDAVTTAMVGSRTPHQIETAAKASAEPPYLPEADLARIPQTLAALAKGGTP
jgi:aryl-alcohol dehydrogenase-like predicted oxidoreductase